MAAQDPVFADRLAERFPDINARKAALMRAFYRLDSFVSLLDNPDVLREQITHYKEKLESVEYDPLLRDHWVDVSGSLFLGFFIRVSLVLLSKAKRKGYNHEIDFSNALNGDKRHKGTSGHVSLLL